MVTSQATWMPARNNKPRVLKLLLDVLRLVWWFMFDTLGNLVLPLRKSIHIKNKSSFWKLLFYLQGRLCHRPAKSAEKWHIMKLPGMLTGQRRRTCLETLQHFSVFNRWFSFSVISGLFSYWEDWKVSKDFKMPILIFHAVTFKWISIYFFFLKSMGKIAYALIAGNNNLFSMLMTISLKVH